MSGSPEKRAGLSEISCVGGHNGKKGDTPWPDAILDRINLSGESLRKPEAGGSRSNRRGRKRSPPFSTGSPQGAPLRQPLGGNSAAPLGSPLWKTGTTAPNHNLDRKCRIKRCSLQTCWERPIRQAEISSEQVAGNVGIRRDGMLGEQTGRLATMPPGIGDGRKCGNSSEVLHIWWLFITETLNY